MDSNTNSIEAYFFLGYVYPRRAGLPIHNPLTNCQHTGEIMRVQIIVPADKLSAVTTAVAQWAAQYPERDYPCFNPDQCWSIAGALLTYIGQRCPMRQDAEVLEALGTPQGLRVLAYETSDQRLRWWETLDGYLTGPRATLQEAAEYAVKATTRGEGMWLVSHSAALCEVWRALGMAERLRGAQFDAPTLKVARRLEAAYKAYNGTEYRPTYA